MLKNIFYNGENIVNIFEESILKTFASMIRYSINNLGGKFDLTRGASALGISEEVIETLLDIFQEAGMIKIISNAEEFYQITMVAEISLAKAIATAKYAQFIELMNTINDYKNKFMLIDI